MASFALEVAGSAFLAGAAIAVLPMVVIGIRKADWPLRRPGRDVPAGAFTRTFLRPSRWPGSPVVRGDHEGS
jgi:hypothetical protein